MLCSQNLVYYCLFVAIGTILTPPPYIWQLLRDTLRWWPISCNNLESIWCRLVHFGHIWSTIGHTIPYHDFMLCHLGHPGQWGKVPTGCVPGMQTEWLVWNCQTLTRGLQVLSEFIGRLIYMEKHLHSLYTDVTECSHQVTFPVFSPLTPSRPPRTLSGIHSIPEWHGVPQWVWQSSQEGSDSWKEKWKGSYSSVQPTIEEMCTH